MTLVWGLSSIPKSAPVLIVPMQDKVIHLVEYAILAILYCYSITRTRSRWNKTAVFLLSVLLAALWGAIDEWHQSFVPNRNPDIVDALADALGALIGCSVFFKFRTARRKKATG